MSASYSDKLTGGARSGPSASGASSGDTGPLVPSDNISELHSYDPVVMHKTDPWVRALVNDEPFDAGTKVGGAGVSFTAGHAG
jgi:hypothetical protein